MLERRGTLGLLLLTLACNPDSAPVAPVYDPLEGISDLIVEGPTEMVRVGSFVDVRLLNGSDHAVTSARSCWRFEVERQDGDTWRVLPNGIFGCSATSPPTFPVGQIYEETLRLPEEGGPGLYRITFPYYVVATGESAVGVSDIFRVEPTGVAAKSP